MCSEMNGRKITNQQEEFSKLNAIHDANNFPASRSIQNFLHFKKRRIHCQHKVRTLVNRHLFTQEDFQNCDETNKQHLRQIKVQHKNYAKNEIQTTKYTVLSFLPKNLFEQFHRFANCYFVLIILLNFIPRIGAIQPFLSMAPVIVIIVIQAIKDLFEDYGRYKSDREVNCGETEIYKSHDDKYHKVRWSELQVGDIVRVLCNNMIPADLLLLHSSDADGICFIETSNIDGESNLKQRTVVKRHWNHENPNEFHPRDFKSIVECQAPNNEIYKFHGNIIPPTNDAKFPVNNSNLLLRGCVIRNTDYVEGIVVYAGHETKTMLNNNGPRYKRSKLERRLNTDVIYCVIMLILMCLAGAVGNGIWAYKQSHIEQAELFIPREEDGNPLDPGLSGFFMFWTMVILLQVLIPISLYVSIEMVKWAQVKHINKDLDLYHEESDTPMRCRALNIPEDLGQIQYVFSDKTGTLTENQMVFRRCTIGGIDYPHAANAARIENAEPVPAFFPSDYRKHHEKAPMTSLEDKPRHSYRRPHSGSIRPHHRRNHSSVTKEPADDHRHFGSHPRMSRSVPNSPQNMRRHSINTKRPAAHHRRNISSVSAREVFESTKAEEEEVIAQEEPNPGDDLETDVTPDPVLLQELSSIRNPAKELINGGSYSLAKDKERILDFFINLALCNTVVLSTDSSELEEANLTPASNNKYKRLTPERESSASSFLAGQTVSGRVHFKETISRQSSSVNSDSDQRRFTNEELSRIRYEAESPDEAALVYAAHAYGCVLAHRSSAGGKETVTITLPNGEGTMEFEVLYKLPFDSVRKRMSVVIRDTTTGRVSLYCKGADSAILSQLSSPSVIAETDDDGAFGEDLSKQESNSPKIVEATKRALAAYARTGLRTLCISKKVLSKQQYNEWLIHHKEAEQALEERDRLLMDSYQTIERDLELLGATGIEDRLQEGVPETIEALRQAGIQVWVVTGDKQETAINIGYSCSLIHQNDEVITLNAENKETLAELLEIHNEAQDEKRGKHPDDDYADEDGRNNSFLNFSISFNFANRTQSACMDDKDLPALVLVIDGRTLGFALQKDVQKKFVRLARRCRSVLCCRATPLQKGEVVKLIRDELNVMTLAIGDGANDVSMIQVADVGIGLSGQEGMQAVMSSDYALAQFRFLKKLLLVHGHWNYARLASMVLYFFYKNAAFVFLIFWFQFFCGFSGGNMIEQWYLLFFNLVFTSVPPLINGILDKDISQETLLRNPSLYKQGINDELYRGRTFWINILDAVYQSLIIFFFVYWSYDDTDVGLIEWGTVVTTTSVFVILVHLGIETKTWTWIHWVCQIGSFFLFFAFALIYNIVCPACSPPSNPYFVMETLVQTSNFWLTILITALVALFPRYIVRAIQSTYFASESQHARVKEMTHASPLGAASPLPGKNSGLPRNGIYDITNKSAAGDCIRIKRPNMLWKEKIPNFSDPSRDPNLEYNHKPMPCFSSSTPDLSSHAPYYGVHRASQNSNNNCKSSTSVEHSAHQSMEELCASASIFRSSKSFPATEEASIRKHKFPIISGYKNVAYSGLFDDCKSELNSETGEIGSVFDPAYSGDRVFPDSENISSSQFKHSSPVPAWEIEDCMDHTLKQAISPVAIENSPRPSLKSSWPGETLSDSDHTMQSSESLAHASIMQNILV